MAIELSNLKPAPGSRRKYKRVGRGNASGKGTTAGRGTKGQRARQGGRKGLRQLGQKWATQATPKLAGFKAVHAKAVALSSSALNKFSSGDTITVSTLVKTGLVPGWAKSVKIVDGGKITKKVSLRGIAASAGIKKQLEAAGGSVTE
jgi:large subunit ribosomal protein L15